MHPEDVPVHPRDVPHSGSAFRWQDARDRVLPLLARYPHAAPGGPVMIRLDPGLRVGFGVDLGPMFVHVTTQLLRAWRLDHGALARQAVANLRERARAIGSDATVRMRFGLVPLAALQVPPGWASSLLLAPDQLPRWFGPGPHVFIAPARNLLIALPSETDQRLVRSLLDEIGRQLPDALDVPPLAWDGARLRRTESDTGPAALPDRGSVQIGGPSHTGRLRSRPDRGTAPRRWGPPRHGARTTWYTPPPDRSVT